MSKTLNIKREMFFNKKLKIEDVRIYVLINENKDTNGMCYKPASFFCKELMISVSTFKRSLNRLQEQNYVMWESDATSRTIMVG